MAIVKREISIPNIPWDLVTDELVEQR